MKIDHYIVSIPPYISTTWDHIRSISAKDGLLIISLNDGEIIRVPKLSEIDIENIFKAHAQWLDEDQLHHEASKDIMIDNSPLGMGTIVSDDGQTTFSLSLGGFPGLPGIPGMGVALEHDAAQAAAPNLPKEVLERVGVIGKMMLPEGTDAIPHAEPHCNCYFCQIARAIQGEIASKASPIGELEIENISDEDLNFCQWEVRPLGDQIFEVINRLDTFESYKVCLQPKMGCTCGQEGCEHLVAVLKS